MCVHAIARRVCLQCVCLTLNVCVCVCVCNCLCACAFVGNPLVFHTCFDSLMCADRFNPVWRAPEFIMKNKENGRLRPLLSQVGQHVEN